MVYVSRNGGITIPVEMPGKSGSWPGRLDLRVHCAHEQMLVNGSAGVDDPDRGLWCMVQVLVIFVARGCLGLLKHTLLLSLCDQPSNACT